MKKLLFGIIITINCYAIDSGIYNCSFHIQNKTIKNAIKITLLDNGKAIMKGIHKSIQYINKHGYWEDYGEEALIIDRNSVLKKEGDIYTMGHGMIQCKKL